MIEVDWTFLNPYQQCPEKGHLRMELNLVPKAIQTWFPYGISIHQGLEVLHTSKSLAEAIVAFSASYRQYDGLDKKRTLTGGALSLNAYNDMLFGEPWEDEGGEVGFAVEISKDIVYKGLIDRWGRYGGQLAIKEFKTSSWPGVFVVSPNNQVTGYHMGASVVLGKWVEIIIVDILNVFEQPKSGKESTRQLIYRQLTTRKEEDWKRFSQDVVCLVEDILEWREKRYWRRNTDACSNYGGCEYRTLCQEGLSETAKKVTMEEGFVESKWTPGERS